LVWVDTGYEAGAANVLLKFDGANEALRASWLDELKFGSQWGYKSLVPSDHCEREPAQDPQDRLKHLEQEWLCKLWAEQSTKYSKFFPWE
jgi:hypothetical protein